MKTKIIFPLLALLMSLQSFAGDFEWSGIYRAEGNYIDNFALDSTNPQKTYGLHHLILKPKIVAADGFNIVGRFDILNSPTHPDTAHGSLFGNRADTTGTPPTGQVLKENEGDDTFKVTQLYLTYVQEFGALIVGRAPLQFGLGISYSAGDGMFDHYYTTRDLIGYKFFIGNLYIMPMIGKLKEGLVYRNDDVTDYIIQAIYDNPDLGYEFGLIYLERKTNRDGNDAVAGTAPVSDGQFEGTGTSEVYKADDINLFVRRDLEKLKIGFEAGFHNGLAGVSSVDGETVKFTGYALAAEVEWDNKAKWMFNTKAGIVSGDDPNTKSKYEGFVFHKNYDLGLLMFNHNLGKFDVFRTGLKGSGLGDNRLDEDAISNVSYLAPSAIYRWKEKWHVGARVVTGWLQKDSLGNGTSRDLGYELDLSLNFIPTKKIIWVNELGFLLPGDAFKGGSAGYSANNAWGLVTKAAISF